MCASKHCSVNCSWTFCTKKYQVVFFLNWFDSQSVLLRTVSYCHWLVSWNSSWVFICSSRQQWTVTAFFTIFGVCDLILIDVLFNCIAESQKNRSCKDSCFVIKPEQDNNCKIWPCIACQKRMFMLLIYADSSHTCQWVMFNV